MIRASHASKEKYGEKEVASIRALIMAGVDVNTPGVLNDLCNGVMPFADYGYRLKALEALVGAGAAPGSALNSLASSFNGCDEAKQQFVAMASCLLAAGADWETISTDNARQRLEPLRVLVMGDKADS
jgi:hypothetical protein